MDIYGVCSWIIYGLIENMIRVSSMNLMTYDFFCLFKISEKV